MKDKFILEVPISEATESIEKDCDIFGIKFNDIQTVEEQKEEFKKILPLVCKPLMIRGSGNDEFDKAFLPQLIKLLKKECIVGIANENNYKSIVPSVIEGNHKLIIRTPIDINLAKEMNILISDMGLALDKIIIDTDIGGLGYGLEYGYSIMEKIKLEKNDKYLNLPIISFVTEETSKTKEAKDKDLAIYLELSSAAAVMACGADYIVFKSEKALKTMRGLA